MKDTIFKYLFLILVTILTVVLINLFTQNWNKNSKEEIKEETIEENSNNYTYVTLRVNMPLDFDELEELFENSMSDYLELNDIGYLTGDGYPLDDVFGPYAVDIEFDIRENKIEDFRNMLSMYQFPKGSYIEIDSQKNEELEEIGELSGVRISFKNLDNNSINNFYEKLSEELEGSYVYKTICMLNSNTPVYYYGKNLDEMKYKINNFINENLYSNKVIVEDVLNKK